MNKALLLHTRPDETFPQNMDFFKVQEMPIPQIEEGEILVKVLYIGIDPVMRVWLSGAKTYIEAVQIGQIMPAFGVGEVIQSKAKDWNKGLIVSGVLECANFCKRNVSTLFKLPNFIQAGNPFIPLTLSILGVTGLTALNSLKQIPAENRSTPEKRKTFCVSSAAGSTGSIALQIAKLEGFRTIGVVSSQDKKQFLMELGADGCVCYNDAKEGEDINVNQLTKLLKQEAPEGIDVYFDNAGEEVLDSLLPAMNKNGYIILCGATSTYNTWKQRGGLLNLASLISKSVKAEGILFVNEKQKIYEAYAEMLSLLQDGAIKHQEEIYLGVESFVDGLKRVFLGQNLGKIIIQIDEQVPMPKY